MDDLRFYVLSNGISVILQRWDDNKERLCAKEPRSRLERLPPTAGLEPGSARSTGRHLTYRATEAATRASEQGSKPPARAIARTIC